MSNSSKSANAPVSNGKSFRVAVVGATGLVGREMMNVLAERQFPVSELLPLASSRSVGDKITWDNKELTVQLAEGPAFKGIDIVLMSAGGGPSTELSPLAAKHGAVVIDNSSAWRMDPDVPLIVPEVNAAAIAGYESKRIIANPNCSTIQMVVALAPLHQKAGLKRIVVSTYQAVSGKGRKAMDELGSQVKDLFNQREPTVEEFPARIAFNCIPSIDVFVDAPRDSDLPGDEVVGYSREELKMREETRKILGNNDIGVCATCVRVPVFNGHAESIVAEFERPISADEARTLLRGAPGVLLNDDPAENGFPMQTDVDGDDATHVGRIRGDSSAPNSLALWCVADNLRKGAASNAVQIAEILARDYL